MHQQSVMRLKLQEQYRRLTSLLNQVQGSAPLMQASVYVRRRRCGKANCRCMRGSLHQDRVLALQRKGRTNVHSLKSLDASMVDAVESWRLFRRYRADLVEGCSQLIRTVDRLGRLRTIKLKKHS
jgi:hypothetical protein